MIAQPMLKLVSWICLALVLVPSLLSLAGVLELSWVRGLALLGTLGWFASALLWMGRRAEDKTDGATI